VSRRREIVSRFTKLTEEAATLSYAEFQRVDIRVGRIVAVDDFSSARKPAYRLSIDCGDCIGVKKSSAQATTATARPCCWSPTATCRRRACSDARQGVTF
jgi:hypothetical protein